MTPPSSKTFTPVSLSAHQASSLESIMKQQVQDAILARSVQIAKGNELDEEWRFVGSIGHLKTFKTRGSDTFSTNSSWASTLENTARATAWNLREHVVPENEDVNMTRSRRRPRGQYGELPVSTRTVNDICGIKEPADFTPPLQSYRTFGLVQSNYRDVVDVHYAANSADFIQQQKILSPTAIDGAVLRTIRATKESYFGIKWLAEKSYVGKRDYCFVEMVGYTINPNGQEIGFVVMASVDVPECPELSSSVARVRMKRTMLVIPTTDAPKSTSEIFIMGASEANEPSLIANAQFRLSMAVLNDISLVIDSQNIANQTLAEMWVPDENRPACNLCTRKFHFAYRRRHHCRLCGDVVCKSCYVNRNVPRAEMARNDGRSSTSAAEICQTKFCVRCVMGLRAIDKQLDEFSQQLSKVMSVDFDTLSMTAESLDEGSEEFFVIHSPVSNHRASSPFLFSKRTRGATRVDLSASLPVGHYGEESLRGSDRYDHQAETPRSVTIGGIGSFSSHGSGSSRSMQSSLSENPVHSSSYSRLRGVLGLSRYNSASSLGSQPELLEEKVILHYDGISRIVAI